MSSKSIFCAAALICATTASASITTDNVRSENLDLLDRAISHATALLGNFATVTMHESTINYSDNYHWTNAPETFVLGNLADYSYDTTAEFHAGEQLEIFFEPGQLNGEVSIYYSGIHGHEVTVEVGDGGGHYIEPETNKAGYIIAPEGTACLMFTFNEDVVLEEIEVNTVHYYVTPTDAALSYDEVGYLWEVIRTANKVMGDTYASLDTITDTLDTLLTAMEPLQDLANYYAQMSEVPDEPEPMSIGEPEQGETKLQAATVELTKGVKFDLTGRQISGTPKGIYIQGGKLFR